jgi:hypothetical protein
LFFFWGGGANVGFTASRYTTIAVNITILAHKYYSFSFFCCFQGTCPSDPLDPALLTHLSQRYAIALPNKRAIRAQCTIFFIPLRHFTWKGWLYTFWIGLICLQIKVLVPSFKSQKQFEGNKLPPTSFPPPPPNPFNQNIEAAVLYKIVQMSYLCLQVRGNCPLLAPVTRVVSYANCPRLRYRIFKESLVL